MKELSNELLLCLDKWIENVNNETINDSILCINRTDKRYIYELLKFNKAINNSCSECKIINLSNSINDNSNENIIYFDSNFIENYCEIKKLKKKKFLYINGDLMNIYKSKDYIRANIQVLDFQKYLYIGQIEPYDFLTSKLDNKIMFLILKYYFSFFTIFIKVDEEIFIKQTTYSSFMKYGKSIINIHQIEEELNLFSSREILTSRLAVFIYRLFSFDIRASITQIGRYFAKRIGSKSKVFTKKALIERKADISFENSIRAYDLQKNEKVENTKKDIANNLLNIEGEKRLDIETISKIVGLDIKIVRKLEKDVIISKI